MPIKFRCEHCQQLLGISRSRAAANVDCPQCGRSLKVPGTVGDAEGQGEQSVTPTNADHQDQDLMSALNELTMLGQGDDDWQSSVPATAPFGKDTARPFDDSGVLMHGMDAPQERAVRPDDEDGRATAVSKSVAASKDAFADSDVGSSITTSEALQGIASWTDSESSYATSSPPAQIATDLLSEMRQASHPSSWFATSIAAFFLIAISGGAGWWLAKSQSLEAWLGTEVAERQVETTGPTFQEAKAEAHLPAAIRVDPSGWVIAVTGQVQYVDDSGQSLPDSGASVFLLPSSRQGNLKVHARSFQRSPSDADRKFSEAALQALGGLRVEADAEGRFEIGTAADVEQYQLVVVSSHKQRTQNMLPDSNVTNALMPWFDSTVHILGQRDSVLKLLSKSVKDIVLTVGK